MKKFSILIPTWNNLLYLKLCVEGIRTNSTFPHQIIVHINEGSDGSLDWVKTQPDIEYTYSEKNVGVCYALNMGRALVTTDYIVYMNDDMYACPEWDLELWKEIEAAGDKHFFISSTAIEPVASSNCVIEKNYGTSPQQFQKDLLLQEYKQLKKEDWQGATWPPNVVHRDTWDLVGGYSIEFSPGMYSDPDFSMKLWLAGIRLFKGVGSSRVYHFGSKSTGRIVKNAGYYTFISKWGITSSTLTKHFLRRGARFDGPLKEPQLGSVIRLKNFTKRLNAAIKLKLKG